jgi:hypothetical protein
MKRRAKILLIIVMVLAIALLVWLFPHLIAFIGYAGRRFYDTVNIVTGSALVLALCALLVAYTNFRRGNTAIMKLVELTASSGESDRINNGERYFKLEVRFKNLGIPLRNPSVSVNGNAGGWLNLQLARYRGDERVESDHDTALEKGMVATYALFSFTMDDTSKRMISSLIEPDARDLCISVYSDGFLVRRFFLKDLPWLKWLRGRWNRLSFLVNTEFERVIMYQGRSLHHTPTILPTLRNYRWQFENFVKWTNEAGTAG